MQKLTTNEYFCLLNEIPIAKQKQSNSIEINIKPHKGNKEMKEDIARIIALLKTLTIAGFKNGLVSLIADLKTINAENIKSNFMKYGVDTLKNHYFDFRGRSSRRAYWFFMLYYFIIAFAAGLISGFLSAPIIYLIVILAMVLPYLGVTVRRLHDLGLSWMVLLISIVPGILMGLFAYIIPALSSLFGLLQTLGNIILVILFCLKGEDKANGWGAVDK